jgi:hypothetical protein
MKILSPANGAPPFAFSNKWELDPPGERPLLDVRCSPAGLPPGARICRPVSCLRNNLHNLRLVPGAGGQPAGLAKMRRRFLRGPGRHLLCGANRSHFPMYLQDLVQRARVPAEAKGWMRCIAFPGGFWRRPSLCPPVSTLEFLLLFLGRDTEGMSFLLWAP